MGSIGVQLKKKKDVKNMSPNELVSWFLMASYVYYDLGKRIMSDHVFDYLTNRLKENWDAADHSHKALINKSHLDATTGYDIKYPSIAKYSALEYLRSDK